MAFDGTKWSVAANGDIRYTGDAHGGASPSYETVIDFHRWLGDLADDAVAVTDDWLDITDGTPSERSTDNIVKLNVPYNIDTTEAEHLYDGSIEQGVAGADVFSGLVVVGAVSGTTELEIIQNGALLTPYWGTGLNADAGANILLRIMVKTRSAGADIDGKRLRVQARELGDKYAEFSLTAGLGNATAAIFTATDLNNQTAAGTIAGWTITNTEGYQTLDIPADASADPFYSQWDKGTQSDNDLYEYTKWIGRRGTAQTIHGINGSLFRGITHQVTYTAESGTGFVEDEVLTWGTGATAGTGLLLATDNGDPTGTLWIQLLTGTTPSGTITGAGSTATTNVVTARTVSPEFIGASTGTNIIGAYGIGVVPSEAVVGDKYTDLNVQLVEPPNNVTFEVRGCEVGEDYVLVGPELTGALNVSQFTLNGLLTGGESTVTVNEAIPSDTPTAGTIRIFNGNTYSRVAYTGRSGFDFTGCTGAPAASNGANTFISYIDKLATAADESFTTVFLSTRSLFIRVRDGAGTPIKTFETTGSLGSAGGSTTVIRTSDA